MLTILTTSQEFIGTRSRDIRLKTHSSTQPVIVANFWLMVGDEQIALQSISALHDVMQDVMQGDAESSFRQTVTLRRAVTQDKRLYAWYRDAKLGKKRDDEVTVVQLDTPGGEPINAWRLENAQPVRWSGPVFHAQSNDIAMEELELRYDAIIWC